MIAKKLKYLLLPLLIIALAHCNTESAGPNPTNPDTTDTLPHKPPVSQNQNKHSGVMMEGFYWNVPGGGRWWDTVEAKIPVLANMAGGYGIDRIWLPPAYKAASGAVSMGYDPYDYYDLGDYYQKGTINTHFGSKRGLIRLINALKKHHISVMEDVVLNHRSGGAKELNPFTKTDTYTNFSGVKSGKLKWRWYDFHPSPVMQHDPGTFGDFPDVCYMCKSVSSQMETWMRWLKNTIGFNGGWRFDFVKGLEPWVITEMKAATGNAFSIGEYFDGNVTKVNNWINSTGTNNVPAAHAFDFPLYFTMVNVFEKTDGSGNIADLINPAKSLAAKRPMKAVTCRQPRHR
jgi:alpha-amylase